jgi:hypothetical protein
MIISLFMEITPVRGRRANQLATMAQRQQAGVEAGSSPRREHEQQNGHPRRLPRVNW